MIEERNTSDSNYRINKKSHHVVMIVAYRDLGKEELIEKMKKNSISVH